MAARPASQRVSGSPRAAGFAAQLLVLLIAVPADAETAREVATRMGSRFEITAVHGDAATAARAVEAAYAEVDRIEALISEWRETSETSAINRAAGVRPVPVSAELFNLIRRALKVSELTGGAFDITFGPIGRLWDMRAPHPERPSPEAVRAALETVGWRKVRLDPDAHTVLLERPGMRLGFGAIGKGYAANRGVFVLKAHGARGGIVNAAGDIVAFGTGDDGRPWRIGIADPRHKDRVFGYLETTETAVVTSGDYERFVVIDGERYSHIVDPRSGEPARELSSVTVICPDGELADALATGISVLGREAGLALVNRLNGVEALVVDAGGTIHLSEGLPAMLLPPPAAP